MRHWVALLFTAVILSGCTPEGASRPVATAAAPAPRPLAERSRADQSHDGDIATQVARRIHDLNPNAYRAVSTKAVGGRVLLTGAVTRPDLRRHATQAASGIEGVVTVQNEVQLTEDSTFDQFQPDAAREQQLMAKMATNPNIGANNFDVRVVNGIVYLLGTAASPVEVDYVREVLMEDPTVKWVVPAVTLP